MSVDDAGDRLTQALWVTAQAPAVVVSGMIWCGLAAQLGSWVRGPDWLALAGLVTGLLACLVVVVTSTRLPSASEETTLAETRHVLGACGVDPGCLVLSRRPRGRAAVWTRGRRQVVLSPALVAALSQWQIRGRDAAALIARVEGRRRAHPGRGDVLLELGLAPWQLLAAVADRAAASAPRLPMVRFAWHARFVTGAIAIAQASVSAPSSGPGSASDGTAAGGPPGVITALIAAVVLATYTTPAARRVYLRRVEAAADRYVEERGLGQGPGMGHLAVSRPVLQTG